MIRRMLAVVLLLSPLAASGQNDPTIRNVIGAWKNSQLGSELIMRLHADGSGDFDGTPINYTLNGGLLTLYQGDSESRFRIVVENARLILSGGDIEKELVFERYENSATGPGVSKIMGLWSDGKEMIEFRPDNYCVYGGERYTYEIIHDQVVIDTDKGPLRITFEIAKDELTLVIRGVKNKYIRVPGQHYGNRTAPVLTGEIMPELLGEWCHVDPETKSKQCVAFRADGTFLYATTRESKSEARRLFSTGLSGQVAGTWWVISDRLHFNSSSSGLGSVSIERRNQETARDYPMIVLEGIPFITTTPRSPWR